MLPSGQQDYVSQSRLLGQNRPIARWVARYRFGVATSQLSERGRQTLGASPDRIDSDYLAQFPEFLEFKGRSMTDNGSTVTDNEPVEQVERRTLEESLQAAYKELRDELTAEILTQIKGMTPLSFEKLVLDLMVAMGSGGVQKNAALTSAGADEGIDGLINEDRLGLDSVYLQAKRWENQVGRPEIQRFVGVRHGQRARKGVFLTTSTFSRDAYDSVATIDPKVVLIDGTRLAQLMIDFNIGFSTTETFSFKRIDSDYFP